MSMLYFPASRLAGRGSNIRKCSDDVHPQAGILALAGQGLENGEGDQSKVDQAPDGENT